MPDPPPSRGAGKGLRTPPPFPTQTFSHLPWWKSVRMERTNAGSGGVPNPVLVWKSDGGGEECSCPGQTRTKGDPLEPPTCPKERFEDRCGAGWPWRVCSEHGMLQGLIAKPGLAAQHLQQPRQWVRGAGCATASARGLRG